MEGQSPSPSHRAMRGGPLPLPRGERGNDARVDSSPSPLAGEGGAQAATADWEGEGARRAPTRAELLARAKDMRSNPTDAERRLWSMLRAHRFATFKFRRQHVIAPYIVDFVCLDRRLVVEADGSQHAGSPGDAARDRFLQAQGYRVLRVWNNDILERSEAVAEAILAALRPTN